MITFRILDIPVRIAPLFWVTLVFIGGGLNATSLQDLIPVLLFVFAGFLSLLTHELGHALAVRGYGLPVAISLVAFGGFASYPAGTLDRRQSFLVTAAGPAIQLALGGVAMVVIQYLPMPEGSLLGYLLLDLIWISIAWAVFNCLPIYPLDGGQMLAAVAGEKRRRLVHMVGIVCALVVAVFLFRILNTWLIPVFMLYFAWINWQGLQR